MNLHVGHDMILPLTHRGSGKMRRCWGNLVEICIDEMPLGPSATARLKAARIERNSTQRG